MATLAGSDHRFGATHSNTATMGRGPRFNEIGKFQSRNCEFYLGCRTFSQEHWIYYFYSKSDPHFGSAKGALAPFSFYTATPLPTTTPDYSGGLIVTAVQVHCSELLPIIFCHSRYADTGTILILYHN